MKNFFVAGCEKGGYRARSKNEKSALKIINKEVKDSKNIPGIKVPEDRKTNHLPKITFQRSLTSLHHGENVSNNLKQQRQLSQSTI